MTARYARNGTVSLAHEDLGGAGGDPLLLVMGLGVSRFWWAGKAQRRPRQQAEMLYAEQSPC